MKYRTVEIDHGSVAYRQACKLRNRLLRIPLGLDLYAEALDAEAGCRHFAVFDSDQLIACLVVVPRGPDEAQIKQMAVEPAAQGQGVGSNLMRAVETRLREAGIVRVWLNARKHAVEFYSGLGYTVCSGEFMEVTIPHLRMCKTL